MSSNVILITGATSGLGLELAKRYNQRGERLVLVGRRDLDTLSNLLFTPENYCQADLTDPDAKDIIHQFLTEQGISQIDVLIHNAGVGYYGTVDSQSADNIHMIVDVNLRAPMLITHALYNHLKSANGKVVMISSIAANLPTPDYTVYAATKAALDEFAYNLRMEVAPDNITVQVIHPGAIRTPMHDKINIPTDKIDTSKFPSAEDTAQKIITQIDSTKNEATIGFGNKVLRGAGKHLAGLIDFVVKRSN